MNIFYKELKKVKKEPKSKQITFINRILFDQKIIHNNDIKFIIKTINNTRDYYTNNDYPNDNKVFKYDFFILKYKSIKIEIKVSELKNGPFYNIKKNITKFKNITKLSKINIKSISWEDLNKSNIKQINLFGYGSLLNHFSHEYEVHNFTKVKLKNYKRLFNINHPLDMTEERDLRFFKISKLLNEDYYKPFNRLLINNRGGLNIIKSKDKKDFVNGLILRIDNKNFEELSQRESIYNIHLEKVKTYNGKTKTIGVLISPKSILEDNVEPYYLYYKSTRHGSYMLSYDFGKDFDRSTFMSDGKTLVIDYFLDKYFTKGKKVKLVSFNFSLKYESEWKLTKNYNKILKVKSINKKKKILNLITENKEIIKVDILDVSPLVDNY